MPTQTHRNKPTTAKSDKAVSDKATYPYVLTRKYGEPVIGSLVTLKATLGKDLQGLEDFAALYGDEEDKVAIGKLRQQVSGWIGVNPLVLSAVVDRWSGVKYQAEVKLR